MQIAGRRPGRSRMPCATRAFVRLTPCRCAAAQPLDRVRLPAPILKRSDRAGAEPQSGTAARRRRCAVGTNGLLGRVARMSVLTYTDSCHPSTSHSCGYQGRSGRRPSRVTPALKLAFSSASCKQVNPLDCRTRARCHPSAKLVTNSEFKTSSPPGASSTASTQMPSSSWKSSRRRPRPHPRRSSRAVSND
jgi:hypothetical protein